MVKYCSVPTCRTPNVQKISVFHCPKDNNQLDQWSKILNCTLRKSSFICEKHFNPKDIKSEEVVTDGSKILYRFELTRKTLRKGALPISDDHDIPNKQTESDSSSTDEEWTEDLNYSNSDSNFDNIETKNVRKPQAVEPGQININKCEEINNTTKTNDIEFSQIVENNSRELHFMKINAESIQINGNKPKQISDTGKTKINIESTNVIKDDVFEDENRQQLFEQIFTQDIQIQLPNFEWGIHQQMSPKRIIFSEIGEALTPTHGKNSVPILTKKVVIDEELHVTILFCNKVIDHVNVPNPNTKEDLECILNIVNNLKICPGGPKVAVFKNVNTRCAYKDERNYWRHNKCLFITDKEESCRFCVSLYYTLDRSIERKRRSTFYQKKLCTISKGTNKKVKLLMEQNKILAKKRKLNHKTQKQIENLHKRMEKIKNEILEERMQEITSPASQIGET